MGNHLIGNPLDGYLYLWNVDNFWSQILNLRNPFYTYNIFYPVGANLALNTSAPLVSLFGLPFLRNIPLYINLLILLSFSFSAFFTFNLIERITNNKLAGFFSGLFYGFSPIMFSYIVSQHYYFSFAAVLIPVGVCYCERFVEKFIFIDLTKILLFFWAIFLIDYYTSVLYLIICLIYILLRIIFLKKFKIFLSLKNIFFYIIVFLFAFFIPLFVYYILVFSRSNLSSFSMQGNYYAKWCSARLSDFITPSGLNPILKQYSETLLLFFKNQRSGDTPYLFLGYISVLFGLFTIFIKKAYSMSLPFLTMGIVVFLLSMGPSTFAFKYFLKLPFMSFIDCPQRFTIGVQFTIASLIGIMFSLLKIKNNILQKVLALFFLVIFLFEYGTFGLPLTELAVPKVYTKIAEEKNGLTVLELPSGLTESKGGFGYDWSIWGLNSMQMYWQTIYHKPRVGGYVSRIDNKTYTFFKSEPIISDLFSLTSRDGKWTGKVFTNVQINNFISKFNLGYIVLSPNSRKEEFKNIVEQIFKNQIITKFEAEDYTLYKIY